MNLYFLVEGRRTEKKVYSSWINHLLPELDQIKFPLDATENSYYIFNGNGFPSLLDNHLKNSVQDINDLGTFSHFVICLDSDDTSVEFRIKEIENFMDKHSIKLTNAKLTILVQHRCIETWFLGNRKVYSRTPESLDLMAHNLFYNVQINDPELMGKPSDYILPTAQYHVDYLTEMLLEKKVRYSKKNPNGVVEKQYLDELIKRANSTTHISSFNCFVDFCEKIKKSLL